MKSYTTGHCQVYINPMNKSRPIPTLHELPIERDRPFRAADTVHAIRQVACSNEEYRWICAALAKRRAKQVRSAPQSKAVPRGKAK